MGLQGVPNLCPNPMRELYSAIKAFFNSGPRSLRTNVGKVPLLIIQHANILRVSFAVRRWPGSIRIPWHKQQM